MEVTVRSQREDLDDIVTQKTAIRVTQAVNTFKLYSS